MNLSLNQKNKMKKSCFKERKMAFDQVPPKQNDDLV